VQEINFDKPRTSKNKVLFENLTPLFAKDRLRLEQGNGSTEDITARIIDMASPIGKGQRGLIVSPPKAGKTMMLQNIAQSIANNNPECQSDRPADRRAPGGSDRNEPARCAAKWSPRPSTSRPAAMCRWPRW
jgi:hypothetical protein